MTKRIVDLEVYGGNTYKHKKWAKTLESVDQNKSNGYAFVGKFINAGQKHELEIGTYVMQYGEFATRDLRVRLLQVTNDGLEVIKEWVELSRGDWALTCRDDIAEYVNKKEEPNPLAAFDTDELIAELERRGIK